MVELETYHFHQYIEQRKEERKDIKEGRKEGTRKQGRKEGRNNQSHLSPVQTDQTPNTTRTIEMEWMIFLCSGPWRAPRDSACFSTSDLVVSLEHGYIAGSKPYVSREYLSLHVFTSLNIFDYKWRRGDEERRRYLRRLRCSPRPLTNNRLFIIR